jgi:DNA transformation protein and related proteins
MPEIKGYKLYVNLGASQTRRRLKGFGHGVRKVATAGRNRAVIIHTATGQNLRALEAKFADVGSADFEHRLKSDSTDENQEPRDQLQTFDFRAGKPGSDA